MHHEVKGSSNLYLLGMGLPSAPSIVERGRMELGAGPEGDPAHPGEGGGCSCGTTSELVWTVLTMCKTLRPHYRDLQYETLYLSCGFDSTVSLGNFLSRTVKGNVLSA